MRVDRGSLAICLSVIVLAVGCREEASQSSPPEVSPERALGRMKLLIRRGQIDEALELTDLVLQNHADDPQALVFLARVADANKQPEKVADYFVMACHAENHTSQPRLYQTTIALVAVGRLYDAVDLLTVAVQKHPDDHLSRRLLYDLLIGSEDRYHGLAQARVLIRQRKFDLDLLLAMSNTGTRSLQSAPLVELTTRNPDDLRPLIGKAKVHFDSNQLDQCIEMLEEIISRHPDFMPAQDLMCFALAKAQRFDRLAEFVQTCQPSIKEYANYWLALGEWSRNREALPEAARSFWEATLRDPDLPQGWLQLSQTLRQMEDEDVELPQETVDAIQQRASQLNGFSQARNRFERSGVVSRAVVADMVGLLIDLGRFWEAEAWSSAATTLPEDDTVDLVALRASVVQQLRADSPWQIRVGHPELEMDLSHLPLPELEWLRSDERTEEPTVPGAKVARFVLLDEAKRRGLSFFGRTGNDLNQPGIGLHQTLGCGGGTLDFDLDGWPDLYLSAAGGKPPKNDSEPNALWRNLEGQFVHVAEVAGCDDLGFGQGVAVGDVNEDGFPDLLVLNYGPNRLYLNQGDGTFKESSLAWRLNPTNDSWSTSGCIADLDQDGLSDVIVLNYCVGLDPVTKVCSMDDPTVMRSCSPIMFDAAADHFFQGEARGRLRQSSANAAAAPRTLGRGLGLSVGAFDDRPGLDLLVANDMTDNHFWSLSDDLGEFAFAESGLVRGLAVDDRSLAQGSMGIATSDLDDDGDVDFYVTNFDREYNTLYKNVQPGMWQDQTTRSRLVASTLPMVGFGTAAIDLDCNGRDELIVTNGHVDIFNRGEERSVYSQAMQLFERTDADIYESIGDQVRGDYARAPHVGRALWTIDANRDDRVDVVVTHQTEPVALLVNRSERQGGFVTVHLKGTRCSRDAIGALVSVTVGDHRQQRWLTSGDGYLCSGERTLRFAVGTATDCDIKIRWPDGNEQTFRSVACNQNLLIIQGITETFPLD